MPLNEIRPLYNPARYKGGPFAAWHRGYGMDGEKLPANTSYPGPGCPALDADLIEWEYIGGRPVRPLAVWEEKPIGFDPEKAAGQLEAARILARILACACYLVEVNQKATIFIVTDLLAPEARRIQHDRVGMADFVESLHQQKVTANA